jgi:hypothetical protein
LGFRVQGSGFMVYGLGSRVQDWVSGMSAAVSTDTLKDPKP